MAELAILTPPPSVETARHLRGTPTAVGTLVTLGTPTTRGDARNPENARYLWERPSSGGKDGAPGPQDGPGRRDIADLIGLAGALPRRDRPQRLGARIGRTDHLEDHRGVLVRHRPGPREHVPRVADPYVLDAAAISVIEEQRDHVPLRPVAEAHGHGLLKAPLIAITPAFPDGGRTHLGRPRRLFDALCFDALCFDALCFDALCFDALCFDALGRQPVGCLRRRSE